MNLLENPQARYGPLPKLELAEKLLAPHPHLKTRQGAMEYLEKHIARVEEVFALFSNSDSSIWAVLQRLKAGKQFANTVRALRVIMVWHGADQELLAEMKSRLEQRRDEHSGLKEHYSYLLTQLAALQNGNRG